jgi:hypothetical protein
MALSGCTLVNNTDNVHGLIYESDGVIWMLNTKQGKREPILDRFTFLAALTTPIYYGRSKRSGGINHQMCCSHTVPPPYIGVLSLVLTKLLTKTSVTIPISGGYEPCDPHSYG